MTSTPPIVLVDTNVWLDLYLPHRPGRSAALDLLREACNRDVSIAFASQSALDVYQQVQADNKRWARESGRLTAAAAVAIKRFAWDCVHEMREVGTPIPVDASDLYLADKFRDVLDDLEDDLVMAACRRAKANYLVTNNLKLLAHAPVDARTPQHMVELLRMGMAQGTGTSGSTTDDAWLYRWMGVANAEG